MSGWYVVAAVWFTVSAIFGVLVGRVLAWAGRWDDQDFSPSGTPPPSAPPGGENR